MRFFGARDSFYNFMIICCLMQHLGCRQPDQPPVGQSISIAPVDSSLGYVPSVQYPDGELEAFLDSINALSPALWMDSISFYPDSIFKNREKLDRTLSPKDFELLKKACRTGNMETELALKIFKTLPTYTSASEPDFFPITFFSFDRRKYDFHKFAIFPGSPDMGLDGEFYFFKSRKLIARHDVFYRHDFDINHYQDCDGKTIVYYKQNFNGGLGIWWYNYYFYKYDGDNLIPILNELQNTNLNILANRSFWLESTVQKTNPLIIKMVYHQDFSDSTNQLRILEDSAIVHYTWDKVSKTLKGNYLKSKISRPQILSYYLAKDYDLLFINTHYPLLKQSLLGKDAIKRRAILAYLNEVKNNYRNNFIPL